MRISLEVNLFLQEETGREKYPEIRSSTDLRPAEREKSVGSSQYQFWKMRHHQDGGREREGKKKGVDLCLCV